MAIKSFTDQLGREIAIPFPPRRIISLVPSQTELLFSLGLNEEVVGLTKFCVHPNAQFKLKPKIGGTKQLNLAIIRKLKPDLIIGNKEENERGQIEALMHEFPVWISDINTLPDAIKMINKLGEICGREQASHKISKSIEAGFNNLLLKPAVNKLRIAYLIWKNPYMVAGNNTFINDMITRTGWQNAFTAERYPQITEEMLQEADPDVILLSSEPYPFTNKHIAGFSAICPRSVIQIADGELFSWYGSRLQYTPKYLYSLKQQFDTFKS